MKRLWIKIAVVLFIMGGVLITIFLLEEIPTLQHVKQHKEHLLLLIKTHYLQAVISFICLYFATAFFLPGALALTVAGGLMFGTVSAALYANLGATTGAVAAFIAARFVLGHWVQERFREQLDWFNKELSHRGHNYLLVLRILPIAPFCVINYCAGITRIPLRTFVWTTSVGMLPGSLIYAFIGEQLRYVEAPADLLSGKVILAFSLLALFALVPVIQHHLPSKKGIKAP